MTVDRTRRGSVPAYPGTMVVPHETVRHGRRLTDPFHWLEGAEQGPVADWTRAQQDLTDAFLSVGTQLGDIDAWFGRFLDRAFVFHAVDTGTRRFMLEDRPGADQPVLIARDFADGRERLVVGPEDLARAGATMLAQEAIFPSPCGTYVAYFVKAAGTDFTRLRIKDVEAGAELDGEFPETVLGAVSWSPDSRGFFYNQNQGDFIDDARRAARPDGLWRHEIGARAADDFLVHPMTWSGAHAIIPTASADGRFLFVNQIRLVADVSVLAALRLGQYGRVMGKPIPLAPSGTATYAYVGEQDGRYFFETTQDSPDGRIVAFDLANPSAPRMTEAVAPQALPRAMSHRTPRSERGVFMGGRFYLVHLDGPAHHLLEFGLDGQFLRELPLPPGHSVAGAGGDRYGNLSAAADGGLLIDLWTFTRAPSAWVLDPRTLVWTLAAPDRDAPAVEDVEVTSIFYPAPDGTRIPASIIARRGTPRDGSAPLLLYGYGASGMAITPEFGLDIAAWVAGGGVYVVANLRGGGEYGEAWHRPTIGPGKTLTFDDFTAAADHLIGAGLAVPERLAIRGISQGGLLVGAALTRRPELFGAAVAEIPLLDPLGIGRDYWSAQLTPEMGNPTEDPEAFAYISAYSPLQNLKPGQAYPPTLVVLADGDAQLLTDGGRKFVATLQAGGGGPHLLQIVRGAGHGGWSKPQMRRTISRELAFIGAALGVTLDLPKEPS